MTPCRPASRPRTPWRRAASLAASSLLALGLLACTTGTPAAPAGSTIYATIRFVDRNVQTGDFEAIVTAIVLDSVSGVPQTGVQVNFFILEGLALFQPDGRGDIQVRTNSHGRSEALVQATGALDAGSQVTVRMVSGEADEVEVSLTVFGSSASARPPVARFTFSPTSPTTSDAVRVDVSGSTDPDCPTGQPDDWRIEWGDDTTASGTFSGTTTSSHTYTRPGTYEITLEVTNCLGETDSTTESVTVT